ncbi:hypothetical protein JET76_27195 [Pseudomonas putida]|uniref:hypothetical protein n=1 Tax=Pseudomonas putida TaxID=303 RepID=UPI0018E684BC|nr:hypothetical protein [Pseudomonas putida]MBI6945009.1 hypothetical protein [Pseudomonas putida]MBI6961370.1 hypothetical protein [Pseudomonas putida]
MKNLVIAALVAVSFAAHADENQDKCKKISAMAGDAMAARQNGDLLEDAMQSVGDQSKFSNAVVMKAYGAPVGLNAKAKEKAVSEFRNEAFAECYQAFN